MNLGVETVYDWLYFENGRHVSAFSDESWGGDRYSGLPRMRMTTVSAFSDESWGGDR